MTDLTRQRCASCGTELPERDARTSCPACGGLLALEHAPPLDRGPVLRARFDARLRDAAPGHVADAAGAARASGVWRRA